MICSPNFPAKPTVVAAVESSTNGWLRFRSGHPHFTLQIRRMFFLVHFPALVRHVDLHTFIDRRLKFSTSEDHKDTLSLGTVCKCFHGQFAFLEAFLLEFMAELMLSEFTKG